MHSVFFYIILGGLVATLFTLGLGLSSLFFKKEGRAQTSNALMRWRVIFQVLTLAAFSILLFFHKS